MSTRIIADLMIPGRGEPVSNAMVVLDHGQNQIRRASLIGAE